MRAARLDAMGRRGEDLLDCAHAAAVARRVHVDPYAFAGDSEGNGDHLTRVTGDAVSLRVQVIDDQVELT
jgi:hypothetical protein